MTMPHDHDTAARTGGTEAEALADRILRASGSSLRHYTMHSIRAAIVKAAQEGIDAALARARSTKEAGR